MRVEWDGGRVGCEGTISWEFAKSVGKLRLESML